MPVKALSTRCSVEGQVQSSPGGKEAFDKLLNAGCKRAPLLFVLSARQPSKPDWKQMRETYAPNPAWTTVLAERLENLAKQIDATKYTTYVPLLLLREQSVKTIKEMELLSTGLRDLASSPLLTAARKWSSYRQMGQYFPLALFCYYVKVKTGKAHFREVTDILSALSKKTLAEDSVRHRAKRALAKLTMNGRSVGLMEFYTELADSRSDP